MGSDDLDLPLMRRAIAQARLAWGRTRPNPHVGCVVARERRVIGEGFHARAGEPHAERAALAACSEDPRGATMYVTLEPCNHHGRTPPCVDAVIAAGIARAVIAQRDPNPVAGGGIERLRAAGIDVVHGVCEDEALLLNPAFNTYHLLKRPLVTLKWAASADGCTSCVGGDSKWISGEAARRRVHAMRAEHDAVLIGIETALRDDARLTIRDAEVPPGPPLRRMVLDANLRLSADHPLVAADPATAVVWCSEKAPADAEARLLAAGAAVHRIPRAHFGSALSIQALLERLHADKVHSLLVEGGRRVAGSFVDANCVDRVAAFVAPAIIGSGSTSLSALVLNEPPSRMADARRLHHVRADVLGDDVLLEGWLTRHLFAQA